MATDALQIEFATADDAPIILQFIRELAEFEKLLHEVTATEQQIKESMFGERKHAEAIIARLDGNPVGFALFFHNYSTFQSKPGIYLEDLFVQPTARDKGIGKALLQKLAAIARERNCGRLQWVVLNWNAQAIRFYEELGAEGQKDWVPFRLQGEALEKL